LHCQRPLEDDARRSESQKAKSFCKDGLKAASVGLAFSFPPLTGRVVDQAGIMTAQSRSELEAMLKNLEGKSGIQVWSSPP
jgi:uncharacterized membrane protein YgcG